MFFSEKLNWWGGRIGDNCGLGHCEGAVLEDAVDGVRVVVGERWYISGEEQKEAEVLEDKFMADTLGFGWIWAIQIKLLWSSRVLVADGAVVDANKEK